MQKCRMSSYDTFALNFQLLICKSVVTEKILITKAFNHFYIHCSSKVGRYVGQ